MTRYASHYDNDPIAHHEQFQDAMEAAHQARAQALKDGTRWLRQSVLRMLSIFESQTRLPARPNSVS